MKHLLLALLLVSASASALTNAEYENLKVIAKQDNDGGKQTDMALTFYLSGMEQGALFMHSVFRSVYKKRWYCPPDNLAINRGNIMKILDTQIESYKKNGAYKPENPLALTWALGLQKTFPCENKQ